MKSCLRMVITILASLMSISHASEVCGILDTVVAASEDSPPFASVMHFSAPNAECSVETRHRLFNENSELLESWACTWYDTEIVEVKTALKRAKKKHKKAFKRYLRSSSSSAEQESILTKGIRDSIKSERDRLYTEMHSDARNLVTALKRCFHKKKIRGTWGKFENYFRQMAKSTVLHSGRWTVCQTAPETAPTTGNRSCIEISAYPHFEQSMGLEVWANR